MCKPHTHTEKELELELEVFIVHKEANFDPWDQSIHCVLHMCLLPKKERSYIEVQSKSLCLNNAYTYELCMTLKLSLPVSMSTYLERIALYAAHVKS